MGPYTVPNLTLKGSEVWALNLYRVFLATTLRLKHPRPMLTEDLLPITWPQEAAWIGGFSNAWGLRGRGFKEFGVTLEPLGSKL